MTWTWLLQSDKHKKYPVPKFSSPSENLEKCSNIEENFFCVKGFLIFQFFTLNVLFSIVFFYLFVYYVSNNMFISYKVNVPNKLLFISIFTTMYIYGRKRLTEILGFSKRENKQNTYLLLLFFIFVTIGGV